MCRDRRERTKWGKEIEQLCRTGRNGAIDMTAEPCMTRTEERQRDLASAKSYLAKLKGGMRTFSAVGNQELDCPASETTAAQLDYYIKRVAMLTARVQRDRLQV